MKADYINDKPIPSLYTKLGKITKAEFGHCGYQEMFVGLSLDFSFDTCANIGSAITGGWYVGNKWNENCKWTLEENSLQHAEMIEKVSQILVDAKVEFVSQLKGKPVELTFDGTILKKWRILTEVL